MLDGGPITAQRTAAVGRGDSAGFGPAAGAGAWSTGSTRARRTVIGTGVQGHSHLPVLGAVAARRRLHLFDPTRSARRPLAEVGPGHAGTRVGRGP